MISFGILPTFHQNTSPFLPSSGYDGTGNIASVQYSGSCCPHLLPALIYRLFTTLSCSSQLFPSLVFCEHLAVPILYHLKLSPSLPTPSHFQPSTSSLPYFRAQTLELVIYSSISIHSTICNTVSTPVVPLKLYKDHRWLCFSLIQCISSVPEMAQYVVWWHAEVLLS